MIKKGVVLLLSLFVIVVLAVLGVAILFRSISERSLAQRFKESTQVFWLAEAGISKGLRDLRSDYQLTNYNTLVCEGKNLRSVSPQNLGEGGYCLTVEFLENEDRKVVAYGGIPYSCLPQDCCIDVNSPPDSCRAFHSVEAVISDIFFDNAIYSAGDVDFNGNAYSVSGDIRYADEFEVQHEENIDGEVTYDTSISPLLELDFSQLESISNAQGNYYDSERVEEIPDSFPSSFWYSRADDGVDNDSDGEVDEDDEWVPNVVYLDIGDDLQLNGDISIGGFYILVGGYDVVINGRGTVDGAVYTQGEFRINGGGGELNVNGGVWTEGVRLNGNAHVAYNEDYMQAIQSLMGNIGSLHIISWKDKPSPYPQSE
jgi:cytoskeletal protein CcmA (bactofilin family)